MRHWIRVSSALLILGMVCGVAQAHWKTRRRLPSFSRVWNLVPGSAADYAVQKDKDHWAMELAIVGKESTGVGDAYWAEISSRPEAPGAGEMVVKALFYRDRKSIVFTRMIWQISGYPAAESDGDFWTPDYLRIAAGYRSAYEQNYSYPNSTGELVNDVSVRPEEYADIPEADDLGAESVITPAGTFSCEHFRYKHKSGDVWVAEKAAPFGLVRAVTKDHTTMILVRLLTGSKDRIMVTPQPFNSKDWERLPRQVFGGRLWAMVENVPAYLNSEKNH